MNPSTAFWRGKRVLVTGHTGFKGGWLAIWLRRLGATPLGLALAPEGPDSLFLAAGLPNRMESAIGDIRDRAGVARTLDRLQPDVVLHLAAQPLVRRSYAEPLYTFETNVMGTIHLLEAVRVTPSVQAVVVVTSDKCYENREWPWPYRESDALGGRDPYSASKACAEIVASAWRRSFFDDGRPVPLATARAGNVIGGGDWAIDRLVPDCIRAIRAGRPVAVRNPDATRPWQHVLEPLRGYLLLAERLVDGGGQEGGHAWNFGPPAEDVRPVSWLVDRVVHGWGDGARWELAAGSQPHEAADLAIDASKARAHLRWRPRLALSQALEMTTSWYKRQHAGEPALELVLEQLELYEALA